MPATVFNRLPTTPETPWTTEAPVVPIPPLSEADTIKAARELVATALAEPAEGLIRADAILKASMDARVKTHLDENIACKKGCGHCCVAGINAFPFEALAIADHIRRSWGTFRRWRLLREIAAYRKDRPGAKLRKCPFVRDGACSIYDVRPLVCRVHHSTDVRACIRNPKSRPPGSEPFYLEAFPLYDGIYEALGDRNGGRGGHDMALAVEAALRNPSARREFAEGGDPFAEAQRDRR